MIDPTSASASQALTAATAAPAGQANGIQSSVNDAVAKALGMSTGDLQSALAGGASMADVAAQHGVSQGDLVSAVQSGLEQARSSLGPAAFEQQLRALHGRTGGHHHHGHHQGAAQAAQSAPDGSGLGQLVDVRVGAEGAQQPASPTSSDALARLAQRIATFRPASASGSA